MLIKAASSAALYVNQMGQLLFGLSSNVILFIYYFRMNRFEHLSEQISGMFRAMMPVFNNQDTSVITPLLASGKQVCRISSRRTGICLVSWCSRSRLKMPLSSLDPILSPVLRETRRVECVTGVPLCNGKMTAVFNYQDATVIVSSLASGSRMCRESRVSKKKSMDLVRFFFFFYIINMI